MTTSYRPSTMAPVRTRWIRAALAPGMFPWQSEPSSILPTRTISIPSTPCKMPFASLRKLSAVRHAKPGPVSQKQVRDALLILATTLPDFKKAFGTKDQVDPVRHLLGSAAAWGGNPDADATYLNVTRSKNDGKTVYRLLIGDVPVNGFWSVSVYNAAGYYEKNDAGAYSLNNLTAKKGADGSIVIQFGGCDATVPNCLPIVPGWNYTVRLYRPRAEIVNGAWAFPNPQLVT